MFFLWSMLDTPDYLFAEPGHCNVLVFYLGFFYFNYFSYVHQINFSSLFVRRGNKLQRTSHFSEL